MSNKKSRVLVIGDLHAPFVHKDYLAHCKKVYEDYSCNKVVFIGDIIDSHYTSYHESDPDGMGGGDELEAAIKVVAEWYKEFPDAHVTVGNHDRIVSRKAFSASIPKRWVKTYSEVLGTPNWKWVTDVIIDKVRYVHGEGGTARNRVKIDGISTVQGHLHTQAYVEYIIGYNGKSIFGAQVGCGMDEKSYAAAYAKAGKSPALSCGVILEGETAIVIPVGKK